MGNIWKQYRRREEDLNTKLECIERTKNILIAETRKLEEDLEDKVCGEIVEDNLEKFRSLIASIEKSEQDIYNMIIDLTEERTKAHVRELIMLKYLIYKTRCKKMNWNQV